MTRQHGDFAAGRGPCNVRAWHIGRGATWDYEGSVFTQAGGVLDNLGTLQVHGLMFNMDRGSILHHPVLATGYTTLHDTVTAGPAAFELLGDNTITGTIAARQRVTLLSTATTETSTSFALPGVANYGTITLDVSAPGASNGLGSKLLNYGTLNVSAVGTGATLGATITNYKTGAIHLSGTGCVINSPLVNNGLLTLGPSTDAQLNGFSFDENGTLAIEADGGTTSRITALASSPVTLAGTLRVTTDGLAASAGSYTILQAGNGNITGRFARMVPPSGSYALSYRISSVTLRVR